jgi:antirestriction protein ArdC
MAAYRIDRSDLSGDVALTSRFLKGARRPSPAATITAAIVARLDAGVKPWVRPWRTTGHGRPLRACGVPYQGINVFWLWLIADAHGYRSPFWMTYRQAQERGGQVRKGETASIAVLFRTYGAAEQVDGGSEDDPADRRDRRVLKSYAVFNADQIDGLSAQYHPGFQDLAGESEGRAEALDRFFGAIPAQLRHQGDQAYYEPLADRISMPPANLFENYDHYYATLAHELSHWTGHESRLARDMRHRFGTAAYAAEELIAELSSAMLGAELGLPVAHLDHHASYIGNWLELLRADDRAIMTAAAKAEEASRLLLALGGVDAHRSDLDGVRGTRRRP